MPSTSMMVQFRPELIRCQLQVIWAIWRKENPKELQLNSGTPGVAPWNRVFNESSPLPGRVRHIGKQITTIRSSIHGCLNYAQSIDT